MKSLEIIANPQEMLGLPSGGAVHHRAGHHHHRGAALFLGAGRPLTGGGGGGPVGRPWGGEKKSAHKTMISEKFP